MPSQSLFLVLLEIERIPGMKLIAFVKGNPSDSISFFNRILNVLFWLHVEPKSNVLQILPIVFMNVLKPLRIDQNQFTQQH